MNKRFSAGGLFLAAVGSMTVSGVASAEQDNDSKKEDYDVYNFVKNYLNYNQKEELYGHLVKKYSFVGLKFGSKSFDNADIDKQLEEAIRDGKNEGYAKRYIESNFSSDLASYKFFKREGKNAFRDDLIQKEDIFALKEHLRKAKIDVTRKDNEKKAAMLSILDGADLENRNSYFGIEGIHKSSEEEFKKNPLKFIDAVFRHGTGPAKGKDKEYIDAKVKEKARWFGLRANELDFSTMGYEDIYNKISDVGYKEEFKRFIIGIFFSEDLPFSRFFRFKNEVLDYVLKAGSLTWSAASWATVGGIAYAVCVGVKGAWNWVRRDGLSKAKELIFGTEEDDVEDKEEVDHEDAGPSDIWTSYGDWERQKRIEKIRRDAAEHNEKSVNGAGDDVVKG